jgi:hypothetical protein
MGYGASLAMTRVRFTRTRPAPALRPAFAEM